MVDVDQDAKDYAQMVLAAKYGRWSEVYGVLDRKPRLINGIPEERTWGALHQAAWWKSDDAVKKLLAYPTCDSEIRTKKNNETDAGKTPLWVAQHVRPDQSVASILENFFKKEREERFGGDIPTYVTDKDGENMDKDGLPLLLLALANYKKTYHPGAIAPSVHFNNLMKEVFAYVDDQSHWKNAMKKTSASVRAFDVAAADFLSTDVYLPNTSDEQRFFA